jgi:hypothetical protein
MDRCSFFPLYDLAPYGSSYFSYIRRLAPEARQAFNMQ